MGHRQKFVNNKEEHLTNQGRRKAWGEGLKQETTTNTESKFVGEKQK